MATVSIELDIHCPKKLRLKNQEEIEWESDSIRDWRVTFPNQCPVTGGPNFDKDNPGGKVNGTVNEKYKYEVWMGDYLVADPELIVKPG